MGLFSTRVTVVNEAPRQTYRNHPISAMPVAEAYATQQGGDRFVFARTPSGTLHPFVNFDWVMRTFDNDLLKPLFDGFREAEFNHAQALDWQLRHGRVLPFHNSV